jgi:hypothetical protein
MFEAPMQQPMQRIDPSFAQIQGGPYNPPQMQQPATPSYQAPMQQEIQQPTSPFTTGPSQDLGDSFFDPIGAQQHSFLDGMVDPTTGEYIKASDPRFVQLQQKTNQQNAMDMASVTDEWRDANTPGWRPNNQEAPGGPFYPQPKVAGPIDPSFAQIGFGRFQDEYGNWIT